MKTQKQQMIKNLWVWKLNENVDNLISLCKKEKITNVFLCNKNKEMIEKIKEAGIKCDFLLGLAYPFYADTILNECKEAMKYGFDGIHLDLEGEDNPELNYHLNEAIRVLINESRVVDIDVSCGKTSDEYFYAINKCQSAHLMNYRRTAFGMFLFARKCLKKIKIPFYIGFETGDGKDFENISYWKLGRKELDKQIYWADLIFRLLYRNYKGISIHYYKTYSELK
jgi:hypothetical protein